MALKKQLNIQARGLAGGIIGVGRYTWDRMSRESSAQLVLFRDEAHAASPNAVAPVIAKVRLNGDDFDAYFGKDALAKLKDRDPIRAQFYRAAKDGRGVVCDLGAQAFADAGSDE